MTKKKYLIAVFVILVGISLLLLMYIYGIYDRSSREFPLAKSPNPKASAHFIKAMEYRTMIGTLHTVIDYDNFLMQPLLNKMEEAYAEGIKLLPKNSAEDVYWWVILNRGIHGIGGTPDRYDKSLDYTNIYTTDDYKIYYKNLVNKIKRFENDDFDFDVPRITQYKFEIMTNLVQEFYSIAANQYEDKKKIQYDKKHLKNLEDIYTFYQNYIKKYLPLSNKINKYEIGKIYISSKLLIQMQMIKLYQRNKFDCSEKKYELLLNNLIFLRENTKKHNIYAEMTKKYTFNNDKWAYWIVETSLKCEKLNYKAKNIIKSFNPKLK